MKKKLILFGVILLCAVLFLTVKIIFFKASSPDREVRNFAREMTRSCPSMIDPETRLDKVTALADNSLRFNHTLIYRQKDSLAIGNLKNYMTSSILDKIKTSPVLRKYLNKNLTWVYSYNDKNGDFIFEISYTPEQFK